MPPFDWDFKHLFFWFEAFWVVIVSPIAIYYGLIRRHPRETPDGYVGKFRRPDGKVVHVMRMPSGQLWVASEEKPGVMPQGLGYVSGREIMKWHKLASSPDGVPRPE